MLDSRVKARSSRRQVRSRGDSEPDQDPKFNQEEEEELKAQKEEETQGDCIDFILMKS